MGYFTQKNLEMVYQKWDEAHPLIRRITFTTFTTCVPALDHPSLPSSFKDQDSMY